MPLVRFYVPLHSLHAIIHTHPLPHKVSFPLPPLVYSCRETFHLFLYFLVQVEITFGARHLSAKKKIKWVETTNQKSLCHHFFTYSVDINTFLKVQLVAFGMMGNNRCGSFVGSFQ